MKAILVIDEMPTRCLDCPLIWDEMNNDIVRCSNGRRLDDNDEYIYKQKPSWCPLKPIPDKACEKLVQGLDAMEKMKSVKVRVVRKTE